MADVPVEKRFRGSVRLVTLPLWRVAKSTDLEDGFAEAQALGMLKPSNVAFIRRCLELDGQLERGEAPTEAVSDALVDELQACALRLNTADPA